MRNVIVVLVLAATGMVYAQSAGAQADVLFRQGKEWMAAGKVSEACAAFDASQKLDPTVPTLMNQANCREKIGQLATAWRLFLEAARSTHAAPDQASRQMHAVATARAAKLEARLSTLRIDVPAGHRIGDLEILRDGQIVDPATWNQAIPIDGGTYQVSARAPDHTGWSTEIVIAAKRDARVVEIPRLRIVQLVRSVPGSSRTPPIRRSGSTWSTKRTIAMGVAAGGVLSLGMGIALGASAASNERDAYALCPDPQLACEGAERANELVRTGHDRAIGANVALGLGVAGVIAAGVLWFTGAPESQGRVVIAPAFSPGQMSVTASRSF